MMGLVSVSRGGFSVRVRFCSSLSLPPNSPLLLHVFCFLILCCISTFAQDTKQPNNKPPSPSKPSPTAEICAPADNGKKTAVAPAASTQDEPSSDSTAHLEEASEREQPSLKLKSSLDDSEDLKPSKATGNQCERTEGEKDLSIQKQ